MRNIIDKQLWQEIISPDSFSGEVKFKETMKAHTYLQIGGPADVFVCPAGHSVPGKHSCCAE